MGIIVRATNERLGRARPDTSPKNIPASSAVAMASVDRGRVGKQNSDMFRNWAVHSEWVRAAINIRKSQISSAEWDIVPYDPEEPSINLTSQKLIKAVFDSPNARLDSFRSFIEPIVEDILVLDAGAIEKVRDVGNRVSQLWGVDGAQIRVSSLWDGDPNEPRYFWYPDYSERARFLNSDLVYIMANPGTNRVIGLSPLETLKLAVDAELIGSDYNRRQVGEAAPDGVMNLGEGARPEDVDAFKTFWQSEIAGKGVLGFIGGTKSPSFIPFRQSNRDMQFREWQEFLVRKIAAVFGLSPQDLGLTMDVNRSTAETQAQQTEDRGLRPLMALIQDYLTREVVWDEGFGGRENGLAFRFTQLNLKETKAKADINKLALGNSPWKTINEARIDDGREPLGEEFDALFIVTPTGVVRLDDIPTAREVFESQQKPEPAPSATAAPAAKPPAKAPVTPRS